MWPSQTVTDIFCRKNVEYGWWILYIMETVQDTAGQDYGKTQNESKKIL